MIRLFQRTLKLGMTGKNHDVRTAANNSTIMILDRAELITLCIEGIKVVHKTQYIQNLE